jgi:hypothetical protein
MQSIVLFVGSLARAKSFTECKNLGVICFCFVLLLLFLFWSFQFLIWQSFAENGFQIFLQFFGQNTKKFSTKNPLVCIEGKDFCISLGFWDPDGAVIAFIKPL